MATKVAPRRDLTRYAVVDSDTGEIFDVGLKSHEAEAYASSYNRSMAGTGRSCGVAPCTILVNGVEASNG